MSEDPNEHEIPQTEAKTQTRRRVANTMLEADSPNLAKIRKLLQVESSAGMTVKQLAKTIPEIRETKPQLLIARTLLDQRLPDLAQPNVENQYIEAKEQQNSEQPQKRKVAFVAKTMLDHNVLAATLLKYEERKIEIAAEEARERANQPVVEFHPVESKRLVQGCPWRWDDESADKFRYCEKCKIHTYNFDGMELPEAEALVFTRENILHPTLYKRVIDGKFMTRDCPVSVRRRKRLIAMSVVGVLAVFALVAMLILMPPAPQSSGESTADTDGEPTEVTEGSTQSGDALRPGSKINSGDTVHSGSKMHPHRSLRSSSTGSSGADSASVVNPGSEMVNPDGTPVKRKRPTFGPEDEDSYWQ